MASSFYSNSQHVDFESVLSMDDQAVIYEDALVDFFENASVREGVIISTVAGQLVEISEEWFAESFELPVDGLGDLSEIPKDAIFDARSIVSLSGEPVSLSGRKNQMKFEFRLLCDIMAKAISVKAGSFNAITVEKFSLITVVVCIIQMNWAKIFFSIFKKMVTPGSNQAKGFAIQISLLLANIPNLELGTSSEFPASKILTKKTVHRFVSINAQAGAEEVFGVSKPKAVSTKRPAADFGAASVPVSTALEPMVEDQQAEFCTEQPADELATDKSAASTEERHWFDLSYEELIAKWAAERQITSPADSNDDIKDDKPVVDDPDTIINQVLQHLDSTSADKHVEPVEEAATMGVITAGEDQQVQEFLAENANDDLLDADEQKSLDDILLTIPVDVPLPSSSMEITKIVMGREIKIPGVTERTWFLSSLPKIPADHKGKAVISNEVHRQRQFDDTLSPVSEFFRLMKKRWADVCLEVTEFCAYRRLLPVGSINFCRALEIVEPDSCVDFCQPTVFTLRLSQFCTIHIQYSFFSRLSTTDISDFLSSIALDRTTFRSAQIYQNSVSVVPSVQFSLDQRPSSPISTDISSSLRFDTTDVDATVSSLPPVSQDFSAALADLQAILSEQIYESQSGISSRLHKIEQVLRDSLSDQAAIFKNLSQEARQEGRTIDDVQTMRFNEFRKNILAQNASIFVGLADVRKEVQEVNAKVDIMASRLNDIQKDAEATKEALSHQLFEFQSQSQENQNILHAQLSELVDYIHRGSADKKGESGSRGPQQTSNVQIEGSAERTPTFAQRVEMAQRHIVHTVMDADANRELLERQAAAERDRKRRRREARALKRRRRD
ncbi:dystroglycan-like [Dorcoceras hygrometricum]|uniref:Dystroglycan-like n=1 Tax=Dorcoceras hygrometricum TaxID=472368 RepID=A0A2Z7AIQ4_9LAMI|nr:dystroglycan-like [Dorcoceras hygrometricum]